MGDAKRKLHGFPWGRGGRHSGRQEKMDSVRLSSYRLGESRSEKHQLMTEEALEGQAI